LDAATSNGMPALQGGKAPKQQAVKRNDVNVPPFNARF
jgi:hypothetical protein